MDGDEKRQRALETGREMLARYKAERLRSSSSNQSAEPSDAESSRHDIRAQLVGLHRASANTSLRDDTHSSISMSEGEGEGDLEGMAGRVAELEELLQGKEAVVEALNAEIDNLRGEASSPNSSQSCSSSINYKDLVLTYYAKLQEFERAVSQRDNLIEDLTASLEQALSARDSVLTQLNAINALPLDNHSFVVEDNKVLTAKVDNLEKMILGQKTIITELKSDLDRCNEEKKQIEMENDTRKAEINDYKLQIDQLNERIRMNAMENNLNITETLEQQKQNEARVEKIKRDMQVIVENFTSETRANAAKHQNEMKEMAASHNEEISRIKEDYSKQMQLMNEQNRSLLDRLNKDLPDLESRHAKELSVFQSQLANYKKSVEALKLQLSNQSEAQHTAQAEVAFYKSRVEEMTIQMENTRRQLMLKNKSDAEMLQEQIRLHKIQLDEMTSKYVASTSVLESKESIERSLDQALTNVTSLKEENDLLKAKLDDVSAKYAASQSFLDASQGQERSITTRTFDPEKSLSRLSGISINTGSEFNETTYQTFDEVALQYQLTKQRLDEKSLVEKKLAERIDALEDDISKTKEELQQAYKDLAVTREQLESVNTELIEANGALKKTSDDLEKANAQLEKVNGELEKATDRLKSTVGELQKSNVELERMEEDLKKANDAKRSYEKELKDVRNSRDRQKSDVSSPKEASTEPTELFQAALYFGNEPKGRNQDDSKETDSPDVRLLQDEIRARERENKNLQENLRRIQNEYARSTKQVQVLTEKLKRAEEESNQLKRGLATAWEQCAEFEEKLNQSLALNETYANESSINASHQVSKLIDLSTSINVTNRGEGDAPSWSDDVFGAEKMDEDKIMRLHKQLAELVAEKEAVLKENQSFLAKQQHYEDIVARLAKLQAQYDELVSEKEKLLEENKNLISKQIKDDVNGLQSRIELLTKENEALTREKNLLTEQMNDLINTNREMMAKHAKELSKAPLDPSDAHSFKTLSKGLREDAASLTEFRAELEARHAKEMEELRTYFEQKCLQMEKQYSEEVFSQQSKKMSDNDSEIEELTEDLYFGSGAECLNVSGPSSKSDVDLRNKSNLIEDSNMYKSQITDVEKLPSIRDELCATVQEVEDLKSEYERKLRDQEHLHQQIVKELGDKIDRRSLTKGVSQLCQTDWDPIALESCELTELRAAYSQQLEEQVALARLDIVNALQEQIQALVSADDSVAQESWPAELLELRDKFTDSSKREIEELKERHSLELSRLKEDHSRALNRNVERYEAELKKLKTEIAVPAQRVAEDGTFSSEDTLIRERDNLHKTCLTLKNLVSVLIKYFDMCEEEVNNTLISEVLKTRLSSKCEEVRSDESVEDIPPSTVVRTEGKDEEESSVVEAPAKTIKRVHFAPRLCGIESIINDDNTLLELIEGDKDVAQELRTELDVCFDRLKQEAAQILGVAATPGESNIDVLTKQILWSSKVNEELSSKYSEAEMLIFTYQAEMERFKARNHELQQKLTFAENKKEIISEGYGEHEESGTDVTIENLSQLHERVRSVLSNGTGDSSYLLQIIEDLCRQGDKVADEAKKEKEDLQLQIEAADKQVRATRKFLEEQASEREIERDEAARKIDQLQEQLKEKDREKERDQRITSESSLPPVPPSTHAVIHVHPSTEIIKVEALESQMHEISVMLTEVKSEKSEVESELKAAVDKIWVLRDIITDLEQQVQSKAEREENLQSQIEQLEEVIAAQTRNQQELVQELDAIKMGSENVQLNEHIGHLQEELRKHKLCTEHFDINSTALKQMKIELQDMEAHLDKKIKELELLHTCGSNLSLSQPSEDVSVREQIDASRCPTPDDLLTPPTLPLDQVLKLKDKLTKHGRAEEVALRRIKDLEMQLSALKNQNEELQAEQEILQQTASDQLFQIEAMRGRLEQQKQNAPFVQRQATSRLELQLHETNATVHSLERAIADKDLQMKDIKMQLDRANHLLLEKESEIAGVVQAENTTIQQLKDRLEVIEEEKKILETKVNVQEQAQKELPQLLDSMLEDKNEEIDHLKEQLLKKEKQLEVFFALNLDEAQLRELLKQAEPKNSARTLSDILSLDSEYEEFPEAIREAANFSQSLPHNVSHLKTIPDSSKSKQYPQLSPMLVLETNKAGVEIPRLELPSQSQSLSESCLPQSLTGVDLIRSVSELKSPPVGNNSRSSLGHKSQESSPRKNVASGTGIEGSPRKAKPGGPSSPMRESKSIEPSLQHFDISNSNEKLMDLDLLGALNELELKTITLDKREAELNVVQRDLLDLRTEMKNTIDGLTQENIFYKDRFETLQESESKVKKDLLEVESALKIKTEELNEYRSKMQTNEKIIMELNADNAKLRRELELKVRNELARIEATLGEKEEDLQNCKDVMLRTDITIETLQARNLEIENENKQLYEYKTKFEACTRELSNCQKEIERLTEGMNNRDLVIRKLEEMARRTSYSGASSPSENKDQEIHHLQEYLKEKDKVIRQMSDDSKSLHKALETIQNKMKESGNVVELRKKLKEERRINNEMRELLQKLQEEIVQLRNNSPEPSEDDVDIEHMVQRELEVSASLDKQIMCAIRSETPKSSEPRRRMERHACNSLDIEPIDGNKQDKFAQSFNDVRMKLKQANKANEELTKVKEDLEIVMEMLRSQVTEYENRILQVKSELEEESRKVARLNEELAKEKDITRQLAIRFQKEQTANHTAQMHDSELISALRMKLEASLDAENKLRRDLSLVRREHKTIETQLNAVREEMKEQKDERTDDSVGLKEQHWRDSVEAEQKKYVALAEKYEKEERKNLELQDNLRRLESDKCKYERELEMANDEKEKLASGLALIEGIKEHLETDLKRTRADLRSREEECAWLHKRIGTINEAETKRQQQRSDVHHELKSLRREIANSHEVMLDLEADMSHLKKELAKYQEREDQFVRCIETLRAKESELMNKLTLAAEEERRLKEQLNDMRSDLHASVKREMELTDELQNERLCSDKAVPAKFVQKIKDANESAQKYLADRNILREKLSKACDEKDHLATRVRLLETQLAQQSHNANNAGIMSAEMIEKLQRLYGMFLRADSRRKALAYQKRFLLCVVGGYQLSEQSTLSVLAQLSHAQRGYTKSGKNKKNPKVRFRCAALVIISIQRMKWLIVRWRTGRRVGTTAVLGNPDRSYVPLRNTTSNHSPPVRDRPTTIRGSSGTLTLEHFLDRFESIQKKMDHAVTDFGRVTSE